MRDNEQNYELSRLAGEKLQALVQKLLQPFTESQIAHANSEWQDAERELSRFRQNFMNEEQFSHQAPSKPE